MNAKEAVEKIRTMLKQSFSTEATGEEANDGEQVTVDTQPVEIEEAVNAAVARYASEKEEEFKTLKAEFSRQQDALTQLLDIVEKLAAVPEAPPARKVHSPFASQVDKDARFKEMAETLKVLNKKK